jgi:hypothetical protein
MGIIAKKSQGYRYLVGRKAGIASFATEMGGEGQAAVSAPGQEADLTDYDRVSL